MYYKTNSFKEYNKIIGEYSDNAYKERFDHSRLCKQLQAAGRLMRQKNDSGIIAFLSHHPDDITHIQKYYLKAQLIKNFTMWPNLNTF